MGIKMCILIIVIIATTLCSRIHGVAGEESSILGSLAQNWNPEHVNTVIYTEKAIDSDSYINSNLTNLTSLAYIQWELEKNSSKDNGMPTSEPSIIVFDFQSEAYLIQALKQVFPKGRKILHGHGLPSYHFIVWPKIISKTEEIHTAIQKLIPDFGDVWTLDSDIYFLFSLNSSYQLWEVYTLKDLTIVQKIRVNNGKVVGMDWDEMKIKMKQRGDFRQVVISATAGFDHDYDWEAKFKPNSTVFESGSAVSIYHFLRDSLNFKELAIQGEFEESNDTNTMTNLEYKVFSGEADLCISLLPLTLRTFKFVNFLQPMTGDLIQAFFVEPDSTAVRDIVYSSFHPNLWMMLIGTLFLFVLLNNVFHYISTRLFRFSNYTDSFEKTFANESFVWIVGLVAQQGWYKSPTSISLRIVFISGLFTGIVSYVAFSAAVTSKLSVTLKFLTEFSGLVDEEYFILGDKDVTPYLSRLPKSLDLGQGGGASFLKSIQEGIDHILTTKTAFLTYVDVYYVKALELNNIKAMSCSEVNHLPATSNKVYFTFLIHKQSPFTELLNTKVLLLLSSGLAKRYDLSYNGGIEASCTPSNEEQRPLSVTDLFTPYIIILTGFAASGMFLLIERVLYIRSQLLRKEIERTDSKEKLVEKKAEDLKSFEEKIFSVLGVKDPKTLWQIHRLD